MKKKNFSKKSPICFSILRLRDLTRALQFSSILRKTIWKKSWKASKITLFQKIWKFQTCFFLPKKYIYPLSFPILGGRNSTRPLHSSPFQISGAYPVPDGGGGVRTEILLSNIGYICCIAETSRVCLAGSSQKAEAGLGWLWRGNCVSSSAETCDHNTSTKRLGSKMGKLKKYTLQNPLNQIGVLCMCSLKLFKMKTDKWMVKKTKYQKMK